MSSGQEVTIHLFVLKELIPFYSIAFAVNMAFGFWDSLRQRNIKQFDEMSKVQVASFENALKINKAKNNSCLDEFKSKVSDKKNYLNMISSVGKFSCGVMCSLLIVSIAYIGMYPDTKFIFMYTIFSVVGSLLPFSTMMLVSSIYCKSSLKSIQERAENQIDGMRSVISDINNNYNKLTD